MSALIHATASLLEGAANVPGPALAINSLSRCLGRNAASPQSGDVPLGRLTNRAFEWTERHHVSQRVLLRPQTTSNRRLKENATR